jgi:signal transduction histidine kinase/CheY-like chemotaxis protein
LLRLTGGQKILNGCNDGSRTGSEEDKICVVPPPNVLRSGPAVGAGSRLDASARSPKSDLVAWPARLIRASATVIILFEIASAVGDAPHPPLPSHLVLRAECLLLGTLLFMVSFQPRLGQRWQLIAFIITSGVIAFTTVLGIGGETADQFFVDLLVLSLGVTSLLPWSYGWQAAANVLMLAGLAAFAAFSPAHDPLLFTHWVGLVAGAGIRQLCAIYGGRYRQEIKHDVEELKRSETELIAAREAALAASNAKSEFLSSMSHEIRTPMNAVLGMADVLAETDLNGEQRRYLNTVINNGNVLLELINSILDLAKVESGRVSLENAPFSPREVVERVLETLAIGAHEKRLELVAQIDPKTPELVNGDPFRLRQILTNLVGNAIKFTERGQVMIILQSDLDAIGSLRFEVHDTGVGIPADKLETVFEPFSQADSSTSRRYGGTGLGLAIVARLVALMGGEITVESTPGSGSVFRFNVRFALAASPNTLQNLPDFSNRRIVVASKNHANRETVRVLLAQQGAAVIDVSSGIEALELIRNMGQRSTPFDAAVLDSSIPDLDGYQVVERIGQSHTPCVMMLPSGTLKVETARSEAFSVRNYVVKPVKRNELISAVASVMGQLGAASPAQLRNGNHASPLLSQSGLRILFADDSPDNRALIKAYMRATPYLVEFAEDGKEAISKFKTGRYDLVFMDIQMPIVDGYTAVEEIRRWESQLRRPPIPIIALSASADMETVRRTKQAGCNLHVSKPLKKAALLETINRCVPQPLAVLPSATAAPQVAETATHHLLA